MVARERLLGKTTWGGGASHSDNSLELRQCLMHETASAINEEFILAATCQSSILVRICKNRKKILSSANLLLECLKGLAIVLNCNFNQIYIVYATLSSFSSFAFAWWWGLVDLFMHPAVTLSIFFFSSIFSI